MPFCPQCHAEFRPGFKECNTCGGVALVEKLDTGPRHELLELSENDLDDAEPVGFTQGGSGRLAEIDGVKIDPARVFALQVAVQIRAILSEADIASALVPIDADFGDNVPRFEVLVKKDAQPRAESVLVKLWREQFQEEGMEAPETDIDTCPACGSKVPLDVEECPECGLVVGTGEERSAAAAEE